jgi:hypothetical protein
MNLEEWYSLPGALVALLDPARVQEYVRHTGWLPQPQLGQGLAALFRRPESDLEQISIPLTPHASHYTRCMRDALVYIAQWEKRPARDLLDDLLLPPADLLRIQDAGPASSGIDAPLDRGLALVLGARKLLLAAACAVARPGQTFFRRINLPEAEQLLHGCRLVHPESSSFDVTLAIPLAAVPSADTPSDPTPFARRVSELLMRSLRRLARALQAGDLDPLLTPAEGEPVLSANLCEALLDLAPPGDADAVTVDVRWARTHPPAAALGPVRLRRDDFPRIEALGRRLRPAQEAGRQTLLGLVETLNGRMNAAGRMEGEVWLTLLDPQGETVRVRADLYAEDYAAAADAHLRALPVSLQGVLRRAGRTASIDDVTDFHVYPRLAPHQESA